MTYQWKPEDEARMGHETDKAIAASLGIHYKTVFLRRRALGIGRAPHPSRKFARFHEVLLEMTATGPVSPAQVAARLGVQRQRVLQLRPHLPPGVVALRAGTGNATFFAREGQALPEKPPKPKRKPPTRVDKVLRLAARPEGVTAREVVGMYSQNASGTVLGRLLRGGRIRRVSRGRYVAGGSCVVG